MADKPGVVAGKRYTGPVKVGGAPVVPTPVTIVPEEGKGRGATRLGTPTAFLMLLGLLLVYYALHGWDKKYGTFNGAFAGVKAIPQKALPTPTTPATSNQPTPSNTQTG